MSDYKLKIDLPAHKLKKGAIFEYDREECCYVCRDLPFFLTPLIDKEEIKTFMKSLYTEAVNIEVV